MLFADIFEEYDITLDYLKRLTDNAQTLSADTLSLNGTITISHSTCDDHIADHVKPGTMYWVSGYIYLDSVNIFYDIEKKRWTIGALNIVDPEINDESDRFIGCSLTEKDMRVLKESIDMYSVARRDAIRKILPDH